MAYSTQALENFERLDTLHKITSEPSVHGPRGTQCVKHRG